MSDLGFNCVVSLGVYAGPHEPKLYPPTKVKTTDKYTSTQKYKIQKCRTEYRIKKQIKKILEIIYWGAGHPLLIEVYRIQNPEYNNTSIAKGTTDPRH